MSARRLCLVLSILCLSACDISDVDNLVQQQQVRSEIDNYEDARRIFWESVYPGNAKTLYCGEKFHSKQRKGINVEHVFPMSWATNGLKCGKRKQCRLNSPQFNLIEADMHNLYPSRSDVNHARSSFRFCDIGGEKRQFGKQCDFEVNTQSRVAEPALAVRGDVARAMFYMADRYKDQGLVIFEKQARMLYSWHKLDPPSAEEVRRNAKIEQLQGNRNRFIDEPESLDALIQKGHFF